MEKRALFRAVMRRVSTGAVALLAGPVVSGPVTNDLVADFFSLNVPAGASPTGIVQSVGATWTYRYENVPHNHDGVYTLMTNGWNVNYRGYGLSSYVSGGYPAGANVRAVVNAGDNPAGLTVPSLASARFLQSWPMTGSGSQWEPTVIVWRAPGAGTAIASIAVTNAGTQITTNTLDYWNGSSLAVRDSVALAGGAAYTLCATQNVTAGHEIHIWRDCYADQQGIIAFSGTIVWTAVRRGTQVSIR